MITKIKCNSIYVVYKNYISCTVLTAHYICDIQ